MDAMLTPSNLKLLEFVMLCDHSPSLREIAKYMGWVSSQGVQSALVKLREAGLVTWVIGKKKTLRATCRFIPASRL